MKTYARDLQERTAKFAENVRSFVRQLPRTLSTVEDAKQLVRSSGSIAANYIEADEALSKKDFLLRVKICRKESKESGLWLRLVDIQLSPTLETMRIHLQNEAKEFVLMFNAIVRSSS